MLGPTPMERSVQPPERSFTIDLPLVSCFLVSLFGHGMALYAMMLAPPAGALAQDELEAGSECERPLYGKDGQWRRRLDDWRDAVRVEVQWQEPRWGADPRIIHEATDDPEAAGELARALAGVQHWDRCICWTCCLVVDAEPLDLFRIVRADRTVDEVAIQPWYSIDEGDANRPVLEELQSWFERYGMVESSWSLRLHLAEQKLSTDGQVFTATSAMALSLLLSLGGAVVTRLGPKPARRRRPTRRRAAERLAEATDRL